jgi:hypothetical protein
MKRFLDNILVSFIINYYFYSAVYFHKRKYTADFAFVKQINLNKKYLEDNILYVSEGNVYKIKSQLDGCTCSRCKVFYYQAVSNQEDESFICWSC